MSDGDTATVDAICGMAVANGQALRVYRRAWERDGRLTSDTLIVHPGGLTLARIAHGQMARADWNLIHPNDIAAWFGLVDSDRAEVWQRDPFAETVLAGLGTSKLARVH